MNEITAKFRTLLARGRNVKLSFKLHRSDIERLLWGDQKSPEGFFESVRLVYLAVAMLAVAVICSTVSIYLGLACLVGCAYGLWWYSINTLMPKFATLEALSFQKRSTDSQVRAADFLTATSATLSDSADNIGRTSKSLNRAVIDQLQSVQDSLAAISNFSNVVEESADFSKASFTMTMGLNEMAQDGMKIAVRSEKSMHEIENVNQQLQEISQIISDVETRTDAIDQIMREAKILSFNAMIEASRAGEAGRGFVVVAKSLQVLSEMCSIASNEIRTLAKSGSAKSTVIIDDIRRRLTETQMINTQFVSTFEGIADGVGRISVLLEKINFAADKQECSIITCSEAMARVYATTASNRKISDQTGACSSFLRTRSNELHAASSEMLNEPAFLKEAV